MLQYARLYVPIVFRQWHEYVICISLYIQNADTYFMYTYVHTHLAKQLFIDRNLQLKRCGTISIIIT